MLNHPEGPELRRSGTSISTLVLVFSVLVCAGSANAATTADYHQRIRDATSALERLKLAYDGEDSSQRAQRASSTVQQVRSRLPRQELVTANGISVQIDNGWLDVALGEYQKIDDADHRRADILAGILERLQALDERVAELENGKAANGADKDENKARLAEILRRPEYNQKAEEGSALARLLERFLRWVLSLFPEVRPIQPGRADILARVAQLFVFALALAVIAYVVWKFGPRLFGRGRPRKRARPEARIVLGERLEPDQTAADLLTDAEALARAGDLRGAIRKAYIALLCELGERKIIGLSPYKTNRDYVQATRERPSLYNSVQRLTSRFELHWYGFVPATSDDWANFRSGYEMAVSSI